MLYRNTDRPAEGARWLYRAAEAGDARALEALTSELEHSGQVYEAIEMWQRATETGSYDIARLFVNLLRRLGRQQEAEQMLRRAAEAGDWLAMQELGTVLQRADRDESMRWFRRAAEAGDPSSMLAVATDLRNKGHHKAAIQWERRALDTGQNAALMLAAVPDPDEEEALRNALRLPASEGNDWAGSLFTLRQLGLLLEFDDRIVDAEPCCCYRQAIEAGYPPAMRDLIRRTSPGPTRNGASSGTSDTAFSG
jgi:tetratricopeptide (TPR) repeat protein